MEFNPILVFLASALSIVPLAKIMGDATDSLSDYLGPIFGGLLNATMGNAPELIICLFALHHGLIDIVKASLCGFVLGNLLFGLGLAMFVGGIKNSVQTFDPKVISINSSLLYMVLIGLIIPSAFHFSTITDREIGMEISIVLGLLYLASISYILIFRRPAIGKVSVTADETGGKAEPAPHAVAKPRWSFRQALGILALVAVALAGMSEFLTDSIQPAARILGLRPTFAGIFLLALVGSLGDYIIAARISYENRLDLALVILMGSTTQLALLIVPVLVIVGFFIGQQMNLIFSQFEIIAGILAVIMSHFLISDGRSTWLEGLMLLAVYVMLGVGFFHAP